LKRPEDAAAEIVDELYALLPNASPVAAHP
jgi:hypothetical protein